MEIIPSLIGSLPRPVSLAKKLEFYYIGRLDERRLEEEYRKHAKRAFEKLNQIGIRIITDGLYRWDDIFNPLIGFIDGIEVNGLFKFYENNFFYRSPVVKNDISLRENPIVEWYNIAKEIQETVYPDATLKAVLPGPITLAYHSINEHYENLEDLAHAYAGNIIGPLVKDLKKAGAEIVELQEPSLAVEMSKATREKSGKIRDNIAKRTLEKLTKHAKLWIVTYFGTPRIIVDNAIINVDLIEGSLPEGISGIIGVGIVNARETIIERRDRIKDKLINLSRQFRKIYITPNTLLDFLPESVAWRKLKLLGKLGGE